MELEQIDMSGFEGSPLALEAPRLSDGEPWCTTQVAGLQYYRYWRWDEFVGHIAPRPGDAVSLMRRPDNAADSAAIEVWWRNGYHIGHLPCGVAAVLAPRIDGGEPVRAYVLDGGDGATWSLVLVLIGRGVTPLHERRLVRVASEKDAILKKEAEAAAAAIWRPSPTGRQKQAAGAWECRLDAVQRGRRSDALAAFGKLSAETLPEADIEPDETLRGRNITQWENIPAWLSTATALRARSYKPSGPAFAWKTGGYGPYALYLIRDAIPLRPRVVGPP